MAQVERATSNSGKKYLTDGVVRYTDITTKTLTAGGSNNEDGLIKVLDGEGDLSVQLDNEGVTLGDGRKIMGGDGVLTNLVFLTDPGTNQIGFVPFTWYGGEIIKAYLQFFVYIPDTLKINEAKVILRVFKTKNEYTLPDAYTQTSNYGKATNIRLYKGTSSGEWAWNDTGFMDFIVPPTLVEVSGAFGSTGYTNTTGEEDSVVSIDIKDSLSVGLNYFAIQTADAIPTPYNDANTIIASQKSQMASAYMSITGFTK